MWNLVLLFQNIHFAVRYHTISCDVISYKIRSAILEDILFFLTGFDIRFTNIMFLGVAVFVPGQRPRLAAQQTPRFFLFSYLCYSLRI